MRKIFVFLVFITSLFSANEYLKNMSLVQLFNKQYYTYICNNRWRYINKYDGKREDLLSLVAYSCLKKRYLTPALDLAKVLKVTKEGRRNATYIVTLFLMKKLIMQVINDRMKIGDIKLPTIKDNTLGIVFYNIEQGNYVFEGNKMVIESDGVKYAVGISKDHNIVITTYKNGSLLKREYYW